MADTEVVDPTDQKAEDILESLGLHPAQLKVQDHLASLHDAGAQPTAPPPMTPPAAEPAPPKLAAPLPSPNNPPPMKRPSMFSEGENKVSQKHHFWGGVLKGLDVAGSIVAPGVMQNIPGTMLNQKVKDASANNTRKAATEQAQADANLKKTTAETQAIEDKPGVKPVFEKTADGSIVQLKTDDQGKTTADVVYHGDSTNPKDPFQLWHQQNPTGKVEDFLKLQKDNKPDKENDFQQYYKDFLSDNKLVDSAHNRTRARTEWAKANQPYGGIHISLEREKLDNAENATRDKKTAPLQQSIDDAEQAHKLAEMGNSGNAEADVDLALSFFKTMRSGGQGIRFTRQEQDLIMGARSSGADLQAFAQKVVGGGQKFTPEQRKQIIQIIDLHAQAAKQAMERIKGGGAEPPAEAPKGGFQAPAGAPAPPAEDGHKLKMNGQVVAISKGGKWVAP